MISNNYKLKFEILCCVITGINTLEMFSFFYQKVALSAKLKNINDTRVTKICDFLNGHTQISSIFRVFTLLVFLYSSLEADIHTIS